MQRKDAATLRSHRRREADLSNNILIVGIYKIARLITRPACAAACDHKPSSSGRYQSAPIVKEKLIIDVRFRRGPTTVAS